MKTENNNRTYETWNIVPGGVPSVRRNCPKCKIKREFINSFKFRVNANGKALDVWLIYRCEHCSTTWNMAIYERRAVETIPEKEYFGFLSNDRALAEEYGRRQDLFVKNRAEAVMEECGYRVERDGSSTHADGEVMGENEERLIRLELSQPMKLRVDSLLAEQLGISRSAIKRWCGRGIIYLAGMTENGEGEEKEAEQKADLFKAKVKDGMMIGIRNPHMDGES